MFSEKKWSSPVVTRGGGHAKASASSLAFPRFSTSQKCGYSLTTASNSVTTCPGATTKRFARERASSQCLPDRLRRSPHPRFQHSHLNPAASWPRSIHLAFRSLRSRHRSSLRAIRSSRDMQGSARPRCPAPGFQALRSESVPSPALEKGVKNRKVPCPPFAGGVASSSVHSRVPHVSGIKPAEPPQRTGRPWTRRLALAPSPCRSWAFYCQPETFPEASACMESSAVRTLRGRCRSTGGTWHPEHSFGW